MPNVLRSMVGILQAAPRLRAALSLAVLLLASLIARPLGAHDLAIDRLTLWVEPARGQLNGQILFDPELTRPKDSKPSPEAERKVVDFLRRNLTIEADGKALEPSYEVRELWVIAGATPGDSVMLSAPLPAGTRELRVRPSEAMKALVVSMQLGEATRSTLVFGGQWTMPYRFDSGQADPAWRTGSVDQWTLDAGSAVPAPVTSATAAPETPRAAPEFVGESAWQQAVRYVGLGIVHILPRGWDHVLFVAGLVLGSGRRLKPLLIQLSAFTVAHSVTLALGALGWVVLPGQLVETLIAVSISVVAIENLLAAPRAEHRAWLVLAFGLLHGQGFARVLGDLALPNQSFLVALVAFNFGVEIGQLIVVAALLLAFSWIRDADRFRRYVVVPGSIFIGAMGAYWAVERLLSG